MRTRTAFAGGLAALIAPVALAQQAEFFGIGHLFEQSSSYVMDLSADGSTAIGWGDGPAVYTQRPFRWTRKQGLQEVLPLIVDRTTRAFAVSADGSVVAGSDGPFMGGGTHAFRCHPAAGMWDLGVLSNLGLSPTSRAMGVSADGSVVCGISTTAEGGTDMFRWTAAGGMVRLGSAVSRGATDISADGAVIVGFTTVGGPGGPHRATRWTEATGFQDLGILPGGEHSSAESVSQDGKVVVGACSLGGSERTVRWTEVGGMQDLGQPIPGVSAAALAVSGDGAVIGGTGGGCCSGQGYDAFLWTEAGGFRNLNNYLPQLGVDLTGWRLTGVRGIGADGRTIAGVGEHNGLNEGWVAMLPEPCEPDCNGDLTLNLADFGCFQARFALGHQGADCNADGTLNLADFGCFQTRFALGCP